MHYANFLSVQYTYLLLFYSVSALRMTEIVEFLLAKRVTGARPGEMDEKEQSSGIVKRYVLCVCVLVCVLVCLLL